jgi:hypothetical protein
VGLQMKRSRDRTPEKDIEKGKLPTNFDPTRYRYLIYYFFSAIFPELII